MGVEPEWIEIKNIKIGDYAALPIIEYEDNPRNLTEEDCWLIGRYIADGHLRKDKRKKQKKIVINIK